MLWYLLECQLGYMLWYLLECKLGYMLGYLLEYLLWFQGCWALWLCFLFVKTATLLWDSEFVVIVVVVVFLLIVVLCLS